MTSATAKASFAHSPASASERQRDSVRRWEWQAWGLAALVGVALSISIARIPIQMTDGLVPMLQVQAAQSPGAVLASTMREDGYLRPFWWVQVKLLFDASRTSYVLAFKGFHIALVFALLALFVALTRPRTRSDVMALAFGMVVLTGMHTFTGMIWEAYPINHYLEIAVLTLAACWVVTTRGGWCADLALAVMFAVAALILESGLLVWVVVAGARLVGMRGASWRSAGLTTALLLGYVYLRFWYLDVGTPGLSDRSTGFGFARLERPEVMARFGDTPLILYGYNVVSSILSLLFSEPRGGVWLALHRWLNGALTPPTVVNVLSSTGATALIGAFIWSRRRAWMSRRFERPDQLMILSLLLVAANSTISFAYTKDDVLSTGGVFYALAAFIAASSALGWIGRVPRTMVAIPLIVLCTLLSAAWASRAVGLHHRAFYMAYTVRYEWAEVDQWLDEQRVTPTSAEGIALVDQLRSNAIESPVVNDFFLPRWARRWWEE
jgi:hypothetical protein